MKYAADFRAIARDALRGKWRAAALTAFAAQLMGALLWGGGSAGSSAGSRSLADEDIAEEFLEFWSELFSHPFAVATIAVLLVWGLIVVVIGGAGTFGYASYNLKLVDGKDARFPDLFSQFNRLWTGFVMCFLMNLYTALWSLLLVIPGIIKSYSYAMTPFILAEDHGITVNEAITRSRRLMKGNKWRLFCLSFSFIGWILLVTFFLVIGIGCMLAALMLANIPLLVCSLAVIFAAAAVASPSLTAYQSAALAAFYRDITA